MLYLASPYSHPDPLVMKTRFLLAEQCCAELMKAGLHVHSPIVHCHEMAIRHNLPTDFAFWRSYNFAFIRRSDAVYVLDIPGLAESVGVAGELEFANLIGLPITYCDENGVRTYGTYNKHS